MANITFKNPFQLTSNIEFKNDEPTSLNLVEVAATLKKPLVEIQVSRVHVSNIAATLKKPVSNIQGLYDNNVWRGVFSDVSAFFDETVNQNINPIKSTWDESGQQKASSHVVWSESVYQKQDTRLNTDKSIPINAIKETGFKDSKPVSIRMNSSFDETLKIRSLMVDKWSLGLPLGTSILTSTNKCFIRNRDVLDEWKDSRTRGKVWKATSNVSRPLPKSWEEPVDQAKLRPGFFWITPPLPPIPPKDIRTNDITFGDYLFSLSSNIVFGVKPEPINRIISKKVYYMLNDFYLKRVSDEKYINISRITATLDHDSYTCRFYFTVVGSKRIQ